MRPWEQKIVEVIAEATAGYLAEKIIREYLEKHEPEEALKHFGPVNRGAPMPRPRPINRMQRYDR